MQANRAVRPMSDRNATIAARVLAPGVATSIQGSIRLHGHALGVSAGGPADGLSAALANRILGNPHDCAVLESTFAGPSLEFLCDTDISVTGAVATLSRNGQSVARNQVVSIKRGDVISIGPVTEGMRTYLAIRGGWCGDAFMGSPSTHLAAGAGGIKGRNLIQSDLLRKALPSFRGDKAEPADAVILSIIRAMMTETKIVRVLPGPDRDDPYDARGFPGLAGPFMTDTAISRMGIKLIATPPIDTAEFPPILSGPVFPGTVQLPPDGNPIVLGCDCQASGGYPRIFQVIKADLPILGQIRPGDEIWFRHVSHATALAILHNRINQFPDLLAPSSG